MAGVILKGDGFVGITDERRRAIYEAEKAAAAMGVLPDDKEKRDAIIGRLERRLAAANRGWRMNQEETVVRVDEQGVARVIDKSQAVGFIKGLPAHPGSRDASSRTARAGRRRPHRETVFMPAPPDLVPVDPRVAAERFHARIVQQMERTGYVPAELRRELAAEGWRLGQPVPQARVDEWCAKFQAEWHAKYGGK